MSFYAEDSYNFRLLISCIGPQVFNDSSIKNVRYKENKMIVLNEIIGSANDELLSEKLHHLSHHGQIEIIKINTADTARSRQKVVTDKGTECGIALSRSQKLYNGAVLHIDEQRAFVIRVNEEQWLRLSPVDSESALELGYHAGNLHWRIRFDGRDLLVALEGPAQRYLDRIAPMLDSHRVVSGDSNAA
ncbi:MAG: urease accessory protein [Oleiphilaceae bacterium]